MDPPGEQPMFGRGRLDHFALNAASEEAFREARRRLVDEGASDGTVTDMGSLLLLSFSDTDEGRHELVWVKPGVPVAHGLRRAEWTRADWTDPLARVGEGPRADMQVSSPPSAAGFTSTAQRALDGFAGRA